MAATTYANLKTQVAEYLNRSDLNSYIPDFIVQGMQRINYGGSEPFPSAPLRIPAMQAQETGTISGSSIAFPTGFLEPIRVAAGTGSNYWALDYVSPTKYTEYASNGDEPTVYTYLNNAIKTAGSGTASYILDYYAAFDALSADADTNWLLTNAPAVLLYASLVEAAPFLGDDARINGWFGLFKSSISALNRSTNRQGGGSLAARVVK